MEYSFWQWFAALLRRDAAFVEVDEDAKKRIKKEVDKNRKKKKRN